jgi:hypothetical protein
MHLYHGSGFDQNELMPGFKRSGKVVKWDNTESNEWLYVAVTKEEAVSMGFASVIEKNYLLDRYKSHGKDIVIFIESGRLPTLAELLKLDVYLYTIQKDDKHEWVLVNNPTNDIKEEYKTKHTLTDCIISKEKIDIVKWAAGKSIKVVDKKHAANNW